MNSRKTMLCVVLLCLTSYMCRDDPRNSGQHLFLRTDMQSVMHMSGKQEGVFFIRLQEDISPILLFCGTDPWSKTSGSASF